MSEWGVMMTMVGVVAASLLALSERKRRRLARRFLQDNGAPEIQEEPEEVKVQTVEGEVRLTSSGVLWPSSSGPSFLVPPLSLYGLVLRPHSLLLVAYHAPSNSVFRKEFALVSSLCSSSSSSSESEERGAVMEGVERWKRRVWGERMERPRRLFCIVNPISGARGGQKAWQEVEGLLRVAEESGLVILQDVLFTSHRLHAFSSARSLALCSSLSSFSFSSSSSSSSPSSFPEWERGEVSGMGEEEGEERRRTVVVSVGGDGTLHEVVNGIMSSLRPHEYDEEEKVRRVARLLPRVAIVPAGSGNGLSASLSLSSPSHAALSLLHSPDRPLDLMCARFLSPPSLSDPSSDPSQSQSSPSPSIKGEGEALREMREMRDQERVEVEEGEERRVFSFLMVSYGSMSDIDFDTEPFRWVGDLRFVVAALWAIVDIHHYRMLVDFAPVLVKRILSPSSSSLVPPSLLSPSELGLPPLPSSSSSSSSSSEEGEAVERLEGASGKGRWYRGEGGEVRMRTEKEESFIWVGLMNTPILATGFIHGPHARIDDGLVDAIIVTSKAPKISLVKYFLHMAFETGHHMCYEDVRYFHVKDFEMKALPEKKCKLRLDVDGESFDIQPHQVIKVTTLPSLCTLAV